MLTATIDAGTSNTRVFLWQDESIIAAAQAPVGVRNTAMDGHNGKLAAAVRDTLHEAAHRAGVRIDDITCILGAGMLTSNVGLVEIPHIAAPVSLDTLAYAVTARHLPEICRQDIYFIPGIKNSGDTVFTDAAIRHMDIMRGEETEAAAMLDCAPDAAHIVLILPGSHNKYIAVSEGRTIRGCLTTLAGELLHALTFDTILADSTGRSYADIFHEEAFLRGAAYRRQFGFGHAAFMTRILSLFQEAAPNTAQNFLLGILLADDLAALTASPLFPALDETVFLVAGSPVMQAAYRTLLENGRRHILLLDQNIQHGLSGRGAVALARRAGLI